MLGGINTSLFLKGLGGFFVLPVIILLLKWAFPTKKNPEDKPRRKALKKSLRELNRK
ncbi:MAG: hypothetical protein WCQ52_04535 [Actinomycetes bacterium]